MNELKQKVAQNLFISFLGRFVAGVLGVISIAFITRTIGSEGFGNYSTVLAFLYIFSAFADFGLHALLTREISKDGADERKLISNFFITRLFLLVVFFLISFIIVSLTPYSLDVKKGVVIASLGFVFLSLSSVLMGVFQKHLKFF